MRRREPTYQPVGYPTIATPAFLYVYVENVDTTHQLALQAGALTIEKPADMPYGDRRATLRDSWGNTWQIATRRAL